MQQTVIRLNQDDILRIVKEALVRESDFRFVPAAARISGKPDKDLCITCTLKDDPEQQEQTEDHSPAWQETESLIADLDKLISEVKHLT